MTDSLRDSLLLTKLNRPRLSGDLVHRPRLLSQLQSLSTLSLVVAPAGYGKTTLVSSWLETSPLLNTWLTLDESDNDFANFVNYLIAAVQTCFPRIGDKTASLFKVTSSPSVASVSKTLINELSAVEQDFILVLDDYHLIHNSSNHQLVSDLLHHPPRSFHLVLAARHDPPIPLPALRARGQVTELRVSDLRFTLDETAFFFQDILHFDLAEQEIVTLSDKTEGWPVSLRLAAIYFRHSGSSSIIGANQGDGNRYLIDYMVNEVTAQLTVEVQEFLMKTSILDHLCGPLCDAIMGFSADSGTSQKHLEWLHRSDFFTTSVHGAQGWYRYHHLLRQYLISEMNSSRPTQEIAALHMRASGWFESQGLLDKAIAHALAAGDMKWAVEIFVRHRRDITNLDDWQVLQSLVKMFPQDVVDQQPELKMAEATLFHFRAQISKMVVALNEAESLLAKSRYPQADRDRLKGEIAARRSIIYYWMGDLEQSISLALFALKKLPVEWWLPRVQVRLYLGVAYQLKGDLTRSLDVLTATDEPDFGPACQARLMGQVSFIYLSEADLSLIERVVTQILEKYDKSNINLVGVLASSYFLGLVHYYRNDLRKAELCFQPVLLHPQQVQTQVFIHSIAALALIYQARGDVAKANELAETLASLSLEMSVPFQASDASALKAELDMRQGNLAAAARWADFYKLPKVIRLPFFYAPPLTYVQVLLAQDTPLSRKKASAALVKLRKIFTADHQTRLLISVFALQTLVSRTEGKEARALKEMEKAVTLAEPGGFIRTFIDLGAAVKPLLVRLKKDGTSPAYIDRILSAFEEEDVRRKSVLSEKTGTGSGLQSELGVTAREMEVLRLLEKRYTDREIAETLFISKETVHSHIAHLGDKLNARGRRAVVQAATEMGLLD
jgi:LuxR family transcriptional regulator, maltose regulon positive regulatory protein